MNPNEIKRLAHAINEHRPDWPISSLTTFIAHNLTNRTYRDAAVALTWVACDTKPDGTPATATPKRVLENGPWWQAAVISGDANGGRPNPPKRTEQCRRCGGVLPACACTRERLAATFDDEPATDDNAHAEAAAFRAQIQARRERLEGPTEEADQ
jgi:hypothetical protein